MSEILDVNGMAEKMEPVKVSSFEFLDANTKSVVYSYNHVCTLYMYIKFLRAINHQSHIEMRGNPLYTLIGINNDLLPRKIAIILRGIKVVDGAVLGTKDYPNPIITTMKIGNNNNHDIYITNRGRYVGFADDQLIFSFNGTLEKLSK